MTYVVALTDTDFHLDESRLGAKALNLMVLYRRGLPVPPGFVLTSAAFLGRRDVDLTSLVEENQSIITSPWVMVRSSAVGEDGSDASFAGQLDSFKVMNRPDLIREAILNCWRSLENSRTNTYASLQGKKLEKMAVIVQEMIEPEYAGVMFTASPLNARQQLIEYVMGHCEKLVSGEVTPDSLTLPCDNESSLPFLNALRTASEEILKCFGRHQDIEWTWASGRLHIVQSRPVTTLNARTDWSSTNVNENYPDKLSPLLYSIARRAYYSYFKSLSQALGVSLDGREEADFYNIIGLWGDRMYYNMTNIHNVISLTPFRALLGKSFDDFVGYQGESETRDAVGSLIQQGRFMSRLLRHGLKLRAYVTKIEARVSHFVERPTERDLATGFHDFLDIRFNYWVNASFADFYAMLAHGALGRYLTWLGVENAAGVQNTLIQSIPNLVSNQPIYEMWQIKQFVLRQGLREVFDESPERVFAELSDNPELAELNAMVRSYLNDWGFRCSGELTFLSDNYQEDPASFLAMLKVYIGAEDVDPQIQFERKFQEQEAELRRIVRGVGSIQGRVLKALVSFTRFAIGCRERVRLQQARAYAHFKKITLALGRQLVRAEVIDDLKDVLYFEYDEVSRLLNQESVDAVYLRSLVKLRKAKIQSSAEYPETFHASNTDCRNQYVVADEAMSLTDRSYSGLPACGGTVTARAVILESIHQIDQLRKGDILVTKQTDPGWICAFPLISGLVVERGGMLSHGAIVAREFGIPAVVGLKDITKLIHTDDIISVDGNQGVVQW
ncbi:MAG: PEP/pyruvate-binding domain-containing protein [Bradymonadia bacterium]